MRGVLARSELRRYLGAQALSLFGDSAMWLALGIWVKSLTGSNAAAGLVFFAFGAPALLAPLAGLLVDRVRRRRLLIVTNLLTAAVVGLLLLVHGVDQLWLIYLVTLAYGASYTVLASAQAALLRTLVPNDTELATANAALQTIRQLTRLLAPLAGAGLYAAVGGGAVAVLDVATFVIAAGILATLRVAEPAPQPRAAGQRWGAELAAGLVHLRQTVVLRQIVLAVAVTLLVVGFGETLVFAVVDTGLGRSPSFVGLLDVAMGAGSVFGGLLSAAAVRRLDTGRTVAVGIVVSAIGAGLLAVPVLVVVLVAMAVFGLGVPWIVVGLWTAMQRRTPERLQGRTFSAIEILVGVPQTVSIGLGAALAAVVHYRTLIAAMVVTMVAAAAYLASRPAQRPAGPAPPDPLAQRSPQPAAASPERQAGG